MKVLFWIGAALAAIATLRISFNALRARYLREYEFSEGLRQAFMRKHPGVSRAQMVLVERALKQFFEICRTNPNHTVMMPSRLADDLWHEFILDTREYKVFCRRAIGRFLHHRPADALVDPRIRRNATRLCLNHARRIEGLDPAQAARLPLLFTLDEQLGAAGGMDYEVSSAGTLVAKGRDSGGAECSISVAQGCAGVAACPGAHSGEGGAGHGGDSGDGGDGGDGGCGGGCGGD